MKVGSLVECVEGFDDRLKRLYSEVTFPTVGVIYTVRSICNIEFPSIRLEEIVNPTAQYKDAFGEVCFDIENFREVQPPMDLSFVEELQYSEQDKLYH